MSESGLKQRKKQSVSVWICYSRSGLPFLKMVNCAIAQVISCLSIKGKPSIVNFQWACQITESTQQLRAQRLVSSTKGLNIHRLE